MIVMQSIYTTFRTKFVPATNTKGARIAVYCNASDAKKVVSYDYGADNPHVKAFQEAMALWNNEGFFKDWNPDFIAGSTSTGMIFIAK